MEKYTIKCTCEQTKKALELGAPIRKKAYPIEILDKCYLINHKGQVRIIPTAEEMINWLEEQGIFIDYVRVMGRYGYRLLQLYENGERNLHIQQQDFNTHKDVVLSAIDSALNYLIESKKG